MKKDRNCGMSMPVYPTYMPNMMPGMPTMGGMVPYGVDMNNMNYSQSGNGTVEQQLSRLNNQINSLERRVSNLENLVGNNSNTYNTSNYQML